jgi:FkbM family methyltransferase
MSEFKFGKYETLDGVKYLVPNALCQWRVETIHKKDRIGMEWMSTFNKDDILIDVGANVGMYALPAAVKYGVRVFAFEPESQNYALLCKNIYLNDISDLIIAYCLAISDNSERINLNQLYLSNLKLGTSCHSFGEEVDFHLKPRASTFKQGCVSVSIDQFIANSDIKILNSPAHIKIDVDGFDYKVILGAMETLKNPNTRSVNIELNTHLDEHNEVFSIMKNFGFKMVSSEPRKKGKFEGIGNHIFVRGA